MTDIFPLPFYSQNMQAQHSETSESMGTICVLSSGIYWLHNSTVHLGCDCYGIPIPVLWNWNGAGGCGGTCG